MLTDVMVEDAVERGCGTGARVVRCERSRYSTSFPIDDVDVSLDDGRTVSLVLKRLDWDVLLAEAAATKPRHLYDPAREVGVYRRLLDSSASGTAHCHAASSGHDGAGAWLLLERVNAPALFQVGDRARWHEASAWLAGFHSTFAARVDDLRSCGVPLLRRDAAFYASWPERAAAGIDDTRLERLRGVYGSVIDRLLAAPPTLIHGEFYASNVLVDDARVCPVDWEMAGVGPAMLDLAALTSGRGWSSEERAAIVDAYFGGTGSDDRRADLDACRIHMAMQWLGWSERWSPPPDRTQDWLAEATDAADRLGI